jgi:DNA-directed RNA polymerase specialized sigma24 family protein
MTNDKQDEGDALAVYRTLWDSDLEGVHELVARHGTGILARGKPYVLIAARNAAISRWRRDQRRHQLELLASATSEQTIDNDPVEAVERRETMAALMAALNALPKEWLHVTWRRAEGHSYSEIADEWVDLNFGERPREATLRQIQRRAMARLRADMSIPSHQSKTNGPR